jgi:cadmium resistance protein CadD (predicted permease)
VQPWVSKVTLTLASGATALGSVTGPYYFQTNPLQYVVMVSIFTAVICTFVVNR